MRYTTVPTEISSRELQSKDFSLSSVQYQRVIIPNPTCISVRDFLSHALSRTDLGSEVGSINYIDWSTKFFFTTKGLQEHSLVPDIHKESVTPIKPRAFINHNLSEGDLIISKDSNIGEIIILDRDYPDWMLSGALYKLPVKKWKYYLLAFIKNACFREQLDLLVPKGATIRHAKSMFLDCKVPLPNQNKEQVIMYVEELTKALINKEKEIKAKHKKILSTIDSELKENQKNTKFNFEFPSINDLKVNNRIDAGFFCEEHKELTFKTLNYKGGYSTLDKQGLKLIPGPSLEIKLLGTRIDSDIPLPGFYRLITPKQISNYGIAIYYEYIGTPRKINPIQYGDILFGESGTGRTMVYLDKGINTINNAHAHILRPIQDECTLEKAITVRSILQYYKEIGITDFLTVGGSGGHLSPSYFDRVFIPEFPVPIQKRISNLYHNPNATIPIPTLRIENFVELDNMFNEVAGITELNFTAQKIKARLDEVIDQIVKNEQVTTTFNFLK